jgi:fibronectin type 3 domain-containing protein
MTLRRINSALLLLVILAVAVSGARAQTYLDTIVFGSSASETGHSFAGTNTFVITNSAVSPAQTARCGGTNNPATVNGGSLTFTLAVDPAWRNYFTVKLWGGDDFSSVSGQDSDMGRLYLYVAATNFVGGANTNYQIGYRHEGDYACLNAAAYKPPLPGRFFYSTTLLPLWMTQGRTNLTLTIQPCGRIYDLGSGGPPGGNYQFNMITNSRGIYQAYTHTDPVLNPVGEVQGSAPAVTVRPSPTVSTLSPGGSYYNGISNYLSGRMSTSVTNFTVNDFLQLAKAYAVSNFSVSYTNPALVTKVIAATDYYASNYYANTSVVNGWGGNYGPIGWAIHLLSPQLQSSLDLTNNFGIGGNVSRRKAWGDMLLASRDYGRFNRNTLSNQGLISGSYIYMANRALLDLTNASAFAETNAQRYLLEAIGLSPWLGDDLAGGGSDYLHGTNYFQVTPKGLTREWGYVGVAYGEMQAYAADFCSWTTNPVFLAQCVKMTKARANFRRPAVDISGGSNYRCMEGVGLLAWRGASESDSEFANEIAYGDRTGWAFGLRCAAATGDTNLIGYAKQMLADNEYFNSLTVTGTIGNQSDSRDALDVFNDYNIISAAADSGVRLPMTDGQPDFAWADEEDGIIAVKHGNERLWLATYYQAKTGTGVNGVGRFYYSTNNFDRYGMVEVMPQINFSGSFYVRPNLMDKPEQNFYVPPDDPLQAYQGERLPLAASDPLATDNQPFLGKALFWATRYGNFLIGINRSPAKTYQLQTPAGFVSATNLITGQNLSGTILVAPQSTVILYLSSPTNSSPVPLAPLSLNASGSATPAIAVDWSAASGATGYNLKRASSSGGPYTVIANVTGTNYNDTSVSRGVTYYYVVSGTNVNGESCYNSMEDSASAGLPPPWNDVDVGAVGTAGNASYTVGTFTVQGAGSDIGGNADSFNFAYLSMTNDGTIYARVASAISGGKVGVMMRASTNANSVMAVALLDFAQNNARFATRTSTGGSPTWQSSGTLSPLTPNWVKVTRAGSSFSGYYSSDGVTWTQLGTSVSITMNNAIVIGLGVTSYSAAQLSTCTLDNVYAANWTPPPAAPLNLTATASNGAVFLKWNLSTNATGYNLQRATISGGSYTPVTAIGTTNFTDTGLTNGTTYYYVVTATNAAGAGGVSGEANATPLPAAPAAPTNLTATVGDTQVTLNWSASAGATGYNVKSSLTNGGSYSVIGTNMNSLVFTNTGLLDGTNYYYVVSALNLGGESTNSLQASARPVSLVSPRLAFQAGGNQILLAWPADHLGWQLQSQTNPPGTGLGTSWTAVPGSAGSNQMAITIGTTNGSVFFRLAYP